LQVHHQSAYVDRHQTDYRGFPGYRPREIAGAKRLHLLSRIFDAHIQSQRVTIDQYWNCSLVPDYLGGGGKRHGRHEDSLPRLKVESFDRQVQGRRARVERYGVLAPDKLRESLLKLFGLRAGRQPPAAQSISYLLYLGIC
jgi:hypothetical protein